MAGWPKGWTRSQVNALSKEQRTELFKTGKIAGEVRVTYATSTHTEGDSPAVKAALDEAMKPVPSPRRRVNLFNGNRKRFEIMGKNGSFTDPIPGYRLYAFKDVGNRVQDALISGWTFVQKEEVFLNDQWNTPLDTDLGSHIRIPANQNDESGHPVYHVIMKKLKIHDEEDMAEFERLHDSIEQSLRAGTFNMTPGEKRYTAANPPVGSPSGLPPITISSGKHSR